MVKKLDILILKAFVGPFIATFFITLFVFMMQILWKYIDDLVGKGLDIPTLAEFLLYASATLVNLALPISILLSSIMTFGKLGENFELVAIKSSGISLLRFMRPLLIVAVILSGVAFLFANNITPVANLKFARIYHDIYEKSPAFDLRPGVFYNGFQGFSIKVAEKAQDSLLNDIIIYEQSKGPQDNTILSEKGKMVMSSDKNFLEFHLDKGHRYTEQYDYDPNRVEFVNLGFRTYIKLFDLGQLNMRQTEDSLFKNNINMKSLRQLTEDIDSLKKVPRKTSTELDKSFQLYVPTIKYKDTPVKKTVIPLLLNNRGESGNENQADAETIKKDNVRSPDVIINNVSRKKSIDSNRYDKIAGKRKTVIPMETEEGPEYEPSTFEMMIPDSMRSRISDLALSKVNSLMNVVSESAVQYKNLKLEINRSEMEWQRKLSVSVSCIVLFLIGAPLGAIIRKGGLGMPIVTALLFFMVYYLLSIFGEKFAKDQILAPFTGMWLPVIALSPVGFFLTYKAMHDSQLFNKEFYFRLGRKAGNIFRLKKSLST